MTNLVLTILPSISVFDPAGEEKYALLTSDPSFHDQFIASFEIINKQFTICTVSEMGPHRTKFSYIPGYTESEITAILFLLRTLVYDYQNDPLLAWKAGIKAIAKRMTDRQNDVDEAFNQEVVDKTLKILVNESLNKKVINTKFIQDQLDKFASLKKSLFNIKNELKDSKVFRLFHPKYQLSIDERIMLIVSAEKAYREATKSVILYNGTLVDFLKAELLSEGSPYEVIQSVLEYLKTYNQNDPSLSYPNCLSSILSAQRYISNYRNKDDSSQYGF